MQQYSYMTPMTLESFAGRAKTPADLRGDMATLHYRNKNAPRKLQAVNRDRKSRGLPALIKPCGPY